MRRRLQVSCADAVSQGIADFQSQRLLMLGWKGESEQRTSKFAQGERARVDIQ